MPLRLHPWRGLWRSDSRRRERGARRLPGSLPSGASQALRRALGRRPASAHGSLRHHSDARPSARYVGSTSDPGEVREGRRLNGGGLLLRRLLPALIPLLSNGRLRALAVSGRSTDFARSGRYARSIIKGRAGLFRGRWLGLLAQGGLGKPSANPPSDGAGPVPNKKAGGRRSTRAVVPPIWSPRAPSPLSS